MLSGLIEPLKSYIISGTPPIVPQVTIDLEIGSTSIYSTVDGIFESSLSCLGNGFFWQGGGLETDWHNDRNDRLSKTVATIHIYFIIA